MMNTLFKHLFKDVVKDYQEIKSELKSDPTNSLLYFKALIYTLTALIQKPIDVFKGSKAMLESQHIFKKMEKLEMPEGMCYFNDLNTETNNLHALIYSNKKVVFFEVYEKKCNLYRAYNESEDLYLTPDLINTLNLTIKQPKKISEVLKTLSEYDTQKIAPIVEELNIYSEHEKLANMLNPEVEIKEKHKTRKI